MNDSLSARGRDLRSLRFEEIYHRHFSMVYRVCVSYLKNRDDAEDAAADVFLRLWRSGKSFQNEEHEKAWLLRVTVNRCLDHLKRRDNRHESIDVQTLAQGADPASRDEALTAILELPDRYKAVIYMYYYEGYDSGEIAEILRKPASTIRNHLREARRYLKGVLTDEE